MAFNSFCHCESQCCLSRGFALNSLYVTLTPTLTRYPPDLHLRLTTLMTAASLAQWFTASAIMMSQNVRPDKLPPATPTPASNVSLENPISISKFRLTGRLFLYPWATPVETEPRVSPIFTTCEQETAQLAIRKSCSLSGNKQTRWKEWESRPRE